MEGVYSTVNLLKNTNELRIRSSFIVERLMILSKEYEEYLDESIEMNERFISDIVKEIVYDDERLSWKDLYEDGEILQKDDKILINLSCLPDNVILGEPIVIKLPNGSEYWIEINKY